MYEPLDGTRKVYRDANTPAPAAARATQRQLDALNKRKQALDLRLFGFTYQQIGDKLGFTKQAAYKIVTSALAAIPRESADKLRMIELDRLDRMQAVLAKRVNDGDLGAIDRWLKIAERRAKILGLDAPTKVEQSGEVTVNNVPVRFVVRSNGTPWERFPSTS